MNIDDLDLVDIAADVDVDIDDNHMLTRRQLAVCLLTAHDDYSTDNIADILDVETATVHAVRSKLRTKADRCTATADIIEATVARRGHASS